MKRAGLTLVEVLVIIVVVVFLLALLVPHVSRTHVDSHSAACQSTLRQIGLGLLVHADRDPTTRYCTGAYDWQHDGCPDSVGWVADLVNMDFARPIDLLCPANPMKGTEKVMELYGSAYNAAKWDAAPGLAQAGICGAEAVWGTEGTPERQAAIERYLLDKGYDTNYTASWYLVRGGVKYTIDSVPNLQGQVASQEIRIPPLAGSSGWASLQNATGPLRRSDVEKSKIPSGNIPLLGDGAAGAPATSIATVDLRYKGKEFLLEGDRITVSYNAGPATYDGKNLVPLAGGVLFGSITGMDTPNPQRTGQFFDEAIPGSTSYGSLGLQDTRGWFCHHLGSCNILMADGSVREYGDLNGYGLLNPGFPTPAPEKVDEFVAGSFDGPEEELLRAEVFSGLRIGDPSPNAQPLEAPIAR